MESITDIKWDSLIETILDKKCILFLGPGVTVNYAQNQNIETAYKSMTGDKDFIMHHLKDNLLIFKNFDQIVDCRHDVKKFYKNDFTNPLLQKLAEIPFHLIISVTPDHTLHTIFEQKKFLFQHNYFSKTNKKNIEYDPRQIPLIYNLFGDVSEETSLIFSHYHLFEYLEWGWVNNSLPETIRTVFNKEQTSNIIFLGFEFDKWYYQLILYLFKLNFEGCRRYAIEQLSNENEMLTLCETNFRINFFQNSAQLFVDNLYEHLPTENRRKPMSENEKPKKWLKPPFVKFLNAAFGQDEWTTFCMCYYEEVYDNFATGQTRMAQIGLLIDHVTKKELFTDLFENCKEHNPVQFEKFAPYYE